MSVGRYLLGEVNSEMRRRWAIQSVQEGLKRKRQVLPPASLQPQAATQTLPWVSTLQMVDIPAPESVGQFLSVSDSLYLTSACPLASVLWRAPANALGVSPLEPLLVQSRSLLSSTQATLFWTLL